MATALEIATRVRNLISERSPAAVNVTIPHIQALIDTGLESYTREAMEDPDKADLLRTTITAACVDGIADISDYVDGTSARISLRDLRTRTVYVIDVTRKAATWLGSYDQLINVRWPTGKFAVFLDADTMYVSNASGTPGVFTGSIVFEVVTIPATIAALPAALEGDFVLFLAALVVKEMGIDGPARRR